MRRLRVPAAILTVLAALGGLVSAQASIDEAFSRFWAAANPAEAVSAAQTIVRSGVAVEEALARLKQGRRYVPDVPRGVSRHTHKTVPTLPRDFAYTLDIPERYDPARKYQVRVQLHGGVGRPDSDGRNLVGALAGAEQIYVMPSAWRDAPWWSGAQIENLRIILDSLKRAYNVDENRIAVSGVSDGATGAFYIAMRDTTPYASFLPLNGFIMILANPSLGLREGLYPNNLRNKPLFVINGGRDQLYPTELVDPYVTHLQRGGVTLAYHPQPQAGHNTAWWPEMQDAFEAFVTAHPRDPLPAELTWETDGSPLTQRAHWLVINRLRAARVAAPLADVNDRPAGSHLNFGVRNEGMRITSVLVGSNAASFGLLPGDLVVSVNGRELPPMLDLMELMALYNPGTRLRLVVTRGEKRVELAGVHEPAMMPRVTPLFTRARPGMQSGRVDLVRTGNMVQATTRGVARFTLLISPDAFDLSAPITVTVDGVTVFQDRVTPDLATLMKWAARDNDRTMLFTAEVPITVP